MEIIQVIPRGYCKGVTRAISLAKKTALDYPNQEIYVLGMLVHNTYVMRALEQLNIKTIDHKDKTRMQLLDEIPENSIVIFTAHGISDAVIRKAEAKGLTCIDASCPDVKKTQDIVSKKLQEAFEIIYIGKKAHPEAEAICSMSDHIHLITNKDDIDQLKEYAKVFVTNQTTMSIFDIEDLFSYIKQKYQNAQFCEEICNATRIRQEAVAALEHQNIDVLYVVGDRYSNNSNRLAQIARERSIPQVYLIDDVNDIEEHQLQHANRVAVTAGASTPTYLTSQVISYLKDYTPEKRKPEIQIENII